MSIFNFMATGVKFPYFRQPGTMDCGAACLRMVAAYYKKNVSLSWLRSQSATGSNGANLYDLERTAAALGFDASAMQIAFDKLQETPLPVILHWNKNHFVVLHALDQNRNGGRHFHIADPAIGLLQVDTGAFLEGWTGQQASPQCEGMALVMQPGGDFTHASPATDKPEQKSRLKKMFSYLLHQKKSLAALIGILVCSNLLLMLLPLLTQKLVDDAIAHKTVSLVWLIIGGQLALLLGKLFIDFFYQRLLLRINIKINRTILSEFIGKLLRLPMSFYESRNTGDIMQRIDDHYRIEHFLTGNSVNAALSGTLFIFYSFLLIRYNWLFFLITLGFSIAYVFFTRYFLRRRRIFNQQQFQNMGANQGHLIEMIQGMQEIKLSGGGVYKVNQWQQTQDKVFELERKFLWLRQFEQAGSFLLRDFKNLLITLFAALAVINGELSIGAMLAIQFILGQINGPVEQFVYLLQEWQDAVMSFDRMQEIHGIPDEDAAAAAPQAGAGVRNTSIELSQVTFAYPGISSEPVLKNLNLTIDEGRVTAIVGASGSGKTTLLKLLMKFYEPQQGTITAGGIHLPEISHAEWRRNCAAVMQDGFIFSDTIARNIALADTVVDMDRLRQACDVALVTEFVNHMPLGFETLLSEGGVNLSKGQKQRLLIARAVYKNPGILFFDEATNSLDANTEKAISENLDIFFARKTVIVVAHRLSTVKNAAKIVVLHKGEIIEQGTHHQLVEQDGAYLQLIKNQLELGE